MTSRPVVRPLFGSPTQSPLQKRMEDWVASGKFEQHFSEGFAEGLADARGGAGGLFEPSPAVPAGIPPIVDPINDDEIVDAELEW